MIHPSDRQTDGTAIAYMRSSTYAVVCNKMIYKHRGNMKINHKCAITNVCNLVELTKMNSTIAQRCSIFKTQENNEIPVVSTSPKQTISETDNGLRSKVTISKFAATRGTNDNKRAKLKTSTATHSRI